MSKGTVGANTVETEKKQFFNCIIEKVECRHQCDGIKQKRAMLYSREKEEMYTAQIKADGESTDLVSGAIQCKITFYRNLQYYFISNHLGKKVKFVCIRQANYCTDSKHSKYEILSHNINSRLLDDKEERDVANQDYTIYYYNLFYRQDKFASKTSQYMDEKLMHSRQSGYLPTGTAIAQVTTSALAGVSGSALDMLFALQFFCLPLITEDDETYYFKTRLIYRECPHAVNIPPIDIQVYPDIEFKFELKYAGLGPIRRTETMYKGDDRDKNTVASGGNLGSFMVKFADIEKEFSYETLGTYNNRELDDKAKKGTLFYTAIHKFSKLLQNIYQMSGDLENEIADVVGKDSALTKDIRSARNGIGRVGYGRLSWITGKISIEPSFSLGWRYYVPDTLAEISRLIEADIGIKATGKLTFDLVDLALLIANKTRKVTRTVAIATSLGSGGLAAIPAILVQAFIEIVTELISRRVSDSLVAKLELSAVADYKPIKFNSIQNRFFESVIEFKLEAKFIAGLDLKIDIEWFFNVEVDAQATVETKASAKFPIKITAADGDLAFIIGAEICPFTVTAKTAMTANFKFFKSKEKKEATANVKPGQSNTVYEKKFDGWKSEPLKFILFPKDYEA